MNGRRIRNEIACLLLTALILGQAVYTSAFPFDNPIIDSIENLFGEIRYDVTIAELVISLLTGAGATPVNSAMAQALETELGTAAYQVGAMYEQGLFSITDGIFHDNGFINAIEDTAVWAQYGLENIFATTADDIALNGEAAIAAAGAANLGAVIASAVSTGAVIASTAGVAALAIGGGIAVGVLIDHIVSQWGGPMASGNHVDPDVIMNAYLNEGGGSASAVTFKPAAPNSGFYQYQWGYSADWISYYITSDGSLGIYKKLQNTPGTTSLIRTYSNKGADVQYTNIYATALTYNRQFNGWAVNVDKTFSTQAEFDAWYQQWKNGNATLDRYTGKLSPDVIGKDGNMPHQGIPGGSGIDTLSFPSMVTPIEDGQGLKPIQWDDYMDLVDEVNQNYTDDPTDQETQAQLWDDFKDPYIIDIEDNPEIPDNPDIPENPDVNYVPDFTDDITPDTVIDDVVLDDVIEDVVPDQPVIPDKPDLTPGEIQENLDVSVTGDITDIFPFCIPFDLIALFEKFGDIDREAPHFHFVLDFGEWLGEEKIYEIDIDLSQWDDVATLCRTLEIALFILGLILITRDLIRG